MSLKEIVKQLRTCKFVDPLDHPLENNVAFIELEKKAQEKFGDYVKGISFLCLIAFLIGIFSHLGYWVIYKTLDILSLLSVG